MYYVVVNINEDGWHAGNHLRRSKIKIFLLFTYGMNGRSSTKGAAAGRRSVTHPLTVSMRTILVPQNSRPIGPNERTDTCT